MIAAGEGPTADGTHGNHGSSHIDFLVTCFAVHTRLIEMIESACQGLELTATEALTLLCLSISSHSVTEIASKVGIQPNGASVMVNRLLSRHLVRRQRSRTDRRVTRVSLTETGQAQAAAIAASLGEKTVNLLSRLSMTEAGYVVSGLERLAS